MKPIRNFSLLLVCLLLPVACKTPRTTQAPGETEPRYLSSKLQITVPYQGEMITLTGTIKTECGKRIQVSVLMPMFRTEIIRTDITPEEILFIDRIYKRYVQASKADINVLLTRKSVNFEKLEKLLLDASQPNAKTTITGEELGINSLKSAKLRLYDFSTDNITITPTKVPPQYTPIELNELLKLVLER
ncbi:hypothetical protein EZS27_025534 [termite gut metagenome]|uniref:DUF4292 domain-containing protein n=1 Tax=termite gut metagenome TaxID=433724 RepID=A0A5J4QTS8_9ZZZZ